MSNTIIGILFIACGLVYGSLSLDVVYNHTIGWLIKNQWVAEETVKKAEKTALGRKPTILLYSLALIIIGVFMLYAR